MGKAIIIPGISFAGLGMGKVHFPSSAISIIAPNIAVGSSCQLDCSVGQATWSVNSETYATIDNNGLLTINSGAFGNDVVVTATDATNPENTATKTIKLFYSGTSSGQFDECTTVDISNNLRNGSWGNPNNSVRVATNTSVGINGYRYILAKTTKANASGYAYYLGICLVTSAAGSSRVEAAQICEMGPNYSNGSTTNLKPIDALFPLFEDNTFVYYQPNASSGSTPVSFALTFEESNNGLYSGDRALRVTEFSGKTTTVVMFK